MNMKVLKYIRCLILILLVYATMTMSAQNKTSVYIKAQATVIDKSEIELITLKNMDIDLSMARDGKIYVSALHDAQAAFMMVKGRANARFRIKFAPEVYITNSTGNGKLLLKYEMYGYPSDNQGAGEPIDATEKILQMSSESKYYFWIGGRIDISNARPGNYDGEFTIEIEYM